MLLETASDFDYLEIGLASPDRIRFWSYGEVEKPETINYRTFKPERKGLFCEKIFGPVKDWECSCGKYRRVRYRGIVCERCGVEVTHSKVRRERMGHIELASPVTHIWFLKGIPGYLGLLLDMTTRRLEEIIYYDSYIITDIEEGYEAPLSVGDVIPATEHLDFLETHRNKVTLGIGASAIKELLSKIDLDILIKALREEVMGVKGQKRIKITKRLRILESLKKSGNRPEWLVLDAIPIMPPDLRPMVQLEGGRFATSDLNDLYRRVVNRNNRLKRLMDIGAPDMIVRNEKRMLQEAVDVLISNGKRGRSVTGSNGRPLKSLGNIIEGKQGRFRQNLLGKRVDYSARSVIVVGPNLKFNQCGLPKEMALELFKPFIIRKLVEGGFVTNVKSAKKKIELRDVLVWDVLEEVIKGQAVLLNRAPTLHRLGIQAFEPILVEGSAIQVHPLVCTAFNADFDGDQMAVHVPLSVEAQSECKLLIMSNNNILSPSSGRSIVTPTQDMILGIYYLTIENPDAKKSPTTCFSDTNEVWRAFTERLIEYQSRILVRIDGKRVETTLGRIIFNETIRSAFDAHGIPVEEYINKVIGKKALNELVYHWFTSYGNEVSATLVDRLKGIGFKYSTLSGISIAVEDLTVPDDKPEILETAKQEVEKIEKMESKGKISTSEKKMLSNEIWRTATQKVSDALAEQMGALNNVYIMANSGARGNMDQVRQLAGMRGLMSDSQGRTIDIPIRSNFKEGLSLTEYFISAYGARKGLVDTALRTADSGYLTRRLVDVAQDVMVTVEDCKTKQGVKLSAVISGMNVVVSLSDMIEGRVTLESVVHPTTKKVIVKKDALISRAKAKEIEESGITAVLTRSVYLCEAERGLCQKCYGLDLATAKMINLGEAVGIIAAQSIGEPGTQLTMRTFHTGGVDLRKASKVDLNSGYNGVVEIPNDLQLRKIDDEDASYWIAINDSTLSIENESGVRHDYNLPRNTHILVKDKQKVKKGDLLAEYDPYQIYRVSEKEGVVRILRDGCFVDEGTNPIKDGYAQAEGEIFVYDPSVELSTIVKKEVAESCIVGKRISSNVLDNTELSLGGIVTSVKKMEKDTRDRRKSAERFEVKYTPGNAYIFLPGSRLYVEDKDKIVAGDVLMKERLESVKASKTEDIVQGLPKVEELFEARKPKDVATLSEFDGIVDIHPHEYYWLVVVTSEEGQKKEYKISKESNLLVYTGNEIKKGDALNTGGINPHDLSTTKGIEATQYFLSQEVQKVYSSQGVQINSKHIEIIVRQMTRKIVVIEMGDSSLLLNEMLDKRAFDKINAELVAAKKTPAQGIRVLLGITRASLNTESFVSASSFQQTAGVLTKAAIEGQADPMRGLKENVIIGKLIPAGTGLGYYKNVTLHHENLGGVDDAQETVNQEEEQAAKEPALVEEKS